MHEHVLVFCGHRSSGGWAPDTRFIAVTAGLLAAVLVFSAAFFAIGRRSGKADGARTGACDTNGKQRGWSLSPLSLLQYQKHKDERP